MRVVTEKYWPFLAKSCGFYVIDKDNHTIAGPFEHQHKAEAKQNSLHVEALLRHANS